MKRLALHAAVALTVACGAGAQAPTPATAMLGRWEYRTPPRPRMDGPALGAGLIVEIEIDSVAGKKFWGRVIRWFAGDMGVASSTFDRVMGEVTDSGTANFTIPFARDAAAPLFVSGVLRGDTLSIKSAFRREEPGPFSTAAGSAFVRRAAP